MSADDPNDRRPERPRSTPDPAPDARDLLGSAAALGGALGGVLGNALGGAFGNAFGGARRAAGALREAIGDVVDGEGPHHVVGYRGFGTGRTALVQGRALRQRTFDPADASHSRWRNLLDSLRRMRSEPLPSARVQVRIAGTTHTVQADAEGFVHQWVTLPEALAPGAWHAASFALHDADPAGAADARGTAGVLVPPATARFGIVSDMDDTVLQSEVSSFLSAARMVLLENARTRLPFPGVAAFYRALQGAAPGATDAVGNPIFYVSSSPWNLYDVIADFLEAQRIPLGPILLRDWDLGPSLVGHRGHKLARIREVFATYPTLPFLLVGDSTQEDPEIYGALAREYPGRVLAIYIRDVGRNAARRASIEALAADVRAAGATLVLAEDTLAAARHAALHGWIGAAAVDEVAADSAASAAQATAERRGTAPATPGVSAEPAETPAATPTLVVDDAVRPRDLD